MSHEQQYTQVKLVRPARETITVSGLMQDTMYDYDPGWEIEIVWIPSQFARVGKYLKINDEDGWQVSEVYSTRTWADLKKHERDHVDQRKASDI